LKKRSLQELHRLNTEDFRNKEKISILFCADHIRSGHNIGSLFRIADAFAMEGILLSNYCVKPPHPEIEKTALGATQTVNWQHLENLIEELQAYQQKGYKLVGVEQTDQSKSLAKFEVDKNQKYILVLGHEINGISQEVLNILDYCIEIPQFGTKHSLNVSVAAGIVAWHFVRGRV